jgi:hypothetical protein
MVPFQTLKSDISYLRLARYNIFKSDEAKSTCMGEHNSPNNPLAAFGYIYILARRWKKRKILRLQIQLCKR